MMYAIHFYATSWRMELKKITQENIQLDLQPQFHYIQLT